MGENLTDLSMFLGRRDVHGFKLTKNRSSPLKSHARHILAKFGAHWSRDDREKLVSKKKKSNQQQNIILSKF